MTDDRLFEYRILYNHSEEISAMNNYHYFMACSAEQALDYHNIMNEHNGVVAQTISVEKYNPWAERWEDRSSILNTK
jgi:hypothetical protein